MEFRATPASRWFLWLIVAVGLVCAGFAASLFYLPPHLGYTVTDDALVVDASLGPFDHGFTVARADIVEVRPVALTDGKRRAGTGAPGLCAGRWSYAALGSVQLATSCGAEGVLVATADGKYVVSPADRAGFVAALGSATSGSDGAASGSDGAASSGGTASGETSPAPGAEQTFAPAPGAPSRLHTALRPVVVLPILVILGVLPKLLRPLVYRVEGGVLVLPAHFASVRVPLAGARVRTGRMGGLKLAGSSGPGFCLGLFRDGGGNYHAAASVRDGVWVEGNRRVFVTPADADAFLAACVAAGAVSDAPGPTPRA